MKKMNFKNEYILLGYVDAATLWENIVAIPL